MTLWYFGPTDDGRIMIFPAKVPPLGGPYGKMVKWCVGGFDTPEQTIEKAKEMFDLEAKDVKEI
jgi:hypothetical protein